MPGTEMVSKRIQVVKCSELDEKKREKIVSLIEKFEEINDEDKMKEIELEILKILGYEPRYDYYIVIGYVSDELNEEMIDDDYPYLTWARRCLDKEFEDKCIIEVRQEL